MMSVVTRNKILQVLFTTFYSTAILCFTGPFMQTFLHTIVSDDMIYIHATLLQATNVATIVLLSHFADHGNIFRRMAFTVAVTAGMFLCYLPLCLFTLPPDAAFVLAVTVGVIQSVFAALHTVCSYKLPYYIIPTEEYGSVLAWSGLVSAGATFGVGALMTALSTAFPYGTLMTFAFPIAAAFAGLAALCILLSRKCAEAPAAAAPEKESVPLGKLFRDPVFYRLIAPNFLRGIANGVTTVLAAVALSIGYNETTTSAMVSAQSIALFAGSAVFAFLSKKIAPRYSVLVGSLPFLFLPLMMIPSNEILLLISFSAMMLGRQIADYAVPASLMYVVPAEISGPYNAWRMILHLGGGTLATTLAVFLPVPVLLILATVFQLYCGISYAVDPITNPRKERPL